MSENTGRTVRLFLADGTPSGLITAEIINWTGHVLAGARTGLPRFLERPELDRTGIYFLSGRDLEDPDNAIVYIGESDNVRRRLAQHNKDDDKGFWERTCVVTSKDQNITKAHARYLEARLITIVQEVGRAALSNGTAPPPITLPEADQSDMTFFIEQIRLVMPVLGFEFLRSRPRITVPGIDDIQAPESPYDSPLFELASRKHGLRAQAREVDAEFVVLAGSLARDTWMQQGTSNTSYSNLHARLVEQGRLVPDKAGLLRFSEDVPFASPSAASAVILGRADNGRRSWRVVGKNISYSEWQEAQVAEAEPSVCGAEDPEEEA